MFQTLLLTKTMVHAYRARPLPPALFWRQNTVADAIFPAFNECIRVTGQSDTRKHEICEFGAGRPSSGGRRPRGEALGQRKKRVTGLGTFPTRTIPSSTRRMRTGCRWASWSSTKRSAERVLRAHRSLTRRLVRRRTSARFRQPMESARWPFQRRSGAGSPSSSRSPTKPRNPRQFENLGGGRTRVSYVFLYRNSVSRI